MYTLKRALPNTFAVARSYASLSKENNQNLSRSVEHKPFTNDHKTLLKSRTCLVTNCNVHSKHDHPSNVARAFASYGANVIVHGVDQQKVAALHRQLPVVHAQQRHGFIAHDLDKLQDSSYLCDQVANHTDRLEVVVHNTVPITVPNASGPTDCDVLQFDEIVRLNLTTPFAIVQKLLPLLSKGYNPSIIFSSSDGNNTNPSNGAVYISKFGCSSSRMLTKLLSNELAGKNIRVNAVDPGRIFTYAAEAESLISGSDKTAAYVWLARDNTLVNGEQLDVKDWVLRDPTMYNSVY